MSVADREETIFSALVALPAAQRFDYLDRACAGDTSLRHKLVELLEAHEDDTRLLSEPATPSPGKTLLVTIPPSEKPGDRIGRYKLMERIGEGGCGIVYVAEQEQPVRRRVALKVIKLGMDTKQVIARFDAERQALAMMDHPNIARVLDAGATDTGRPFFVMELVRGIKITDYCDENKLNTAERLELFVQVCRAIQHAHQKGVIHRDIKPSNILVTVNDGQPVPKVIDFGIAKATQGRLTEQTVYTAFEQFIGTPAYMSPEQAVMTSLDIDTRSDIYSLGVLLYELLTGRTPFDATELMKEGLDAMRQTIRERDPMRPSTKLNHLTGDELTTTAKRRGSDAPRLINLLRGDLDWIVMKALEKDRTRRYETANGLATDIERHLSNEPVEARPPSKLYRFQKLVRRNKMAFAGSAALALALLLGVIVSSMQAIRATRAEAAAIREREQAEIMNRFLKVDLLAQATPDAFAPEEMRKAMADVLNRASARLDADSEIARLPELHAKLRLAFGGTYSKLGKLNEAERDLRRAVELRRQSLGQASPETLEAQEALAWLLVGALKNYAEGEKWSRETWQTRKRVLGAENPDTLDSMDTCASALLGLRKFAESEALYRECLLARERVLGTNDNATLITLGNLGQLFSESGSLTNAESVLRDVVERRNRAGLGDTVDTFAGINNLGVTLLVQDRWEDAERLLEDARRRVTQIFGPENPVSTLHLQHTIARVYAGQGRLDEAEALAAQTLAVRRRVASSHESMGRTLLILGRVKVEKGRFDEAEPLLREALVLFREHCPIKRELAAQAANWLGVIQVGRHLYPEAESLLLADPEQFFAPTAQMSSAELRAAVGHIIQLYEAWPKPDKAASWRKKLDELAQPVTR